MEKVILLASIVIVMSIVIVVLAIFLFLEKRKKNCLNEQIGQLKKSVAISEKIEREMSQRIFDFRIFLENDFKKQDIVEHHFVNTAHGTLFSFNVDDRKIIQSFLTKMHRSLFEEWVRDNCYTKESFHKLISFNKSWLTHAYAVKEIFENGNVIDCMCSSLKSAVEQAREYEQLESISTKWQEWQEWQEWLGVYVEAFSHKWKPDIQVKAMELSNYEFQQLKLATELFVKEFQCDYDSFRGVSDIILKMNLVLERDLLSKESRGILYVEFKSAVGQVIEKMKETSTSSDMMTIASNMMHILEEVNQKFTEPINA